MTAATDIVEAEPVVAEGMTLVRVGDQVLELDRGFVHSLLEQASAEQGLPPPGDLGEDPQGTLATEDEAKEKDDPKERAVITQVFIRRPDGQVMKIPVILLQRVLGLGLVDAQAGPGTSCSVPAGKCPCALKAARLAGGRAFCRVSGVPSEEGTVHIQGQCPNLEGFEPGAGKVLCAAAEAVATTDALADNINLVLGVVNEGRRDPSALRTAAVDPKDVPYLLPAWLAAEGEEAKEEVLQAWLKGAGSLDGIRSWLREMARQAGPTVPRTAAPRKDFGQCRAIKRPTDQQQRCPNKAIDEDGFCQTHRNHERNVPKDTWPKRDDGSTIQQWLPKGARTAATVDIHIRVEEGGNVTVKNDDPLPDQPRSMAPPIHPNSREAVTETVNAVLAAGPGIGDFWSDGSRVLYVRNAFLWGINENRTFNRKIPAFEGTVTAIDLRARLSGQDGAVTVPLATWKLFRRIDRAVAEEMLLNRPAPPEVPRTASAGGDGDVQVGDWSRVAAKCVEAAQKLAAKGYHHLAARISRIASVFSLAARERANESEE